MKESAKRVVRKKRPESEGNAVNLLASTGVAELPKPQIDELEGDPMRTLAAEELTALWLPTWSSTALIVDGARINPGEKLEKVALVVDPPDPLRTSIFSKSDDPLLGRREYLRDINRRKELISFEFIQEFVRGVSTFVEKTRQSAVVRWRTLYDPRMYGAIPNYVKWQARHMLQEEMKSKPPTLEDLSTGARCPDLEPEPMRFKDPGLFVEKIFDDLAVAVALCNRTREFSDFISTPFETFPIPSSLVQRNDATTQLLREEYSAAHSNLEQISMRREFDQILGLGECVEGRVRSQEAVETEFYTIGLAAWERAKSSGSNAMIEWKKGEHQSDLWIEKAGTWAEEFTDIEKVQKMRHLHASLDRDRTQHKKLQAREDKSATAEGRVRWFTELVNIESRIKKNEQRLVQLEG